MKLDINYVANLARLDLSEKEKEKFSGQLAGILDYMEQLGKVDTGNVIPTSHTNINQKQAIREDEVKHFDNREQLLKNAPDTEGAFFKVPKVL